MMTGCSRGDKGLPASCCSKPAGMNMGECVPARTGPFSTGTRWARPERGRRSASPCREEEGWISNPPGHGTSSPYPQAASATTQSQCMAGICPGTPYPPKKGLPLPCGDPLPKASGVPTNWLPTLALVVAGNPSVMAGREAALCKANWARELSCSIRRWARGACTKHNPSVSCSGEGRAQHGAAEGGGQVPDTGGTPRAGGTGGSACTRRAPVHTAEGGSVSLGRAEGPHCAGAAGLRAAWCRIGAPGGDAS